MASKIAPKIAVAGITCEKTLYNSTTNYTNPLDTLVEHPASMNIEHMSTSGNYDTDIFQSTMAITYNIGKRHLYQLIILWKRRQQ